MWTDVSALGLALLATWFAGRRANRKRTYGYARLEVPQRPGERVLLLAITVFIVVEALAHEDPSVGCSSGRYLIATIGLGANAWRWASSLGHSLNVSAFSRAGGRALQRGVLVAPR
jgi:cobalt-zinc-cadmium efflux system protein